MKSCYDALANMIDRKDQKLLMCKKCGKKTWHLKCGFGAPGSICGNARFRCLECDEERI
jgi:ribosomal protein L37E